MRHCCPRKQAGASSKMTHISNALALGHFMVRDWQVLPLGHGTAKSMLRSSRIANTMQSQPGRHCGLGLFSTCLNPLCNDACVVCQAATFDRIPNPARGLNQAIFMGFSHLNIFPFSQFSHPALSRMQLQLQRHGMAFEIHLHSVPGQRIQQLSPYGLWQLLT